MAAIIGTQIAFDVCRQIATNVISRQISSTFSTVTPRQNINSTPSLSLDFKHIPKNNIHVETKRVKAFLQKYGWELYYPYIKSKLEGLLQSCKNANANSDSERILLQSFYDLVCEIEVNYQTILQKIKTNEDKYFASWRHTNYEDVTDDFTKNHAIFEYRLNNVLKFFVFTNPPSTQLTHPPTETLTASSS